MPTDHPRSRPHGRTWRRVMRAAVATVVFAAVLVFAVGSATVATASTDVGVVAAPADLQTVISRITNWLVGLLVALSTLLLTIGGLRYLMAGGDPGEVSKAKDTLKYAALGYGVAALAPVLVNILKGFVA